jgi:hypothetical protein
MTTPVDVTFRNMAASPVLDHEIQARAAWLTNYQPHIQFCRVVFEVPHRHHRRGREICVTVEVGLPEGSVHMHHTHPPDASQSSAARADTLTSYQHHREALEAIREAFHVTRRRLADAARRQRGA